MHAYKKGSIQISKICGNFNTKTYGSLFYVKNLFNIILIIYPYFTKKTQNLIIKTHHKKHLYRPDFML